MELSGERGQVLGMGRSPARGAVRLAALAASLDSVA